MKHLPWNRLSLLIGVLATLATAGFLQPQALAQKKSDAVVKTSAKAEKPDAAGKLSADLLAFWVREPEAKKKYAEAFKRSSIEAMLNYYKANFPGEKVDDNRDFPRVKCPVLMLHGLDDPYLLPGAINDTWKYLDKDFTLVTIPKAGHFVHRDAADLVTKRMAQWLTQP